MDTGKEEKDDKTRKSKSSLPAYVMTYNFKHKIANKLKKKKNFFLAKRKNNDLQFKMWPRLFR